MRTGLMLGLTVGAMACAPTQRPVASVDDGETVTFTFAWPKDLRLTVRQDFSRVVEHLRTDASRTVAEMLLSVVDSQTNDIVLEQMIVSLEALAHSKRYAFNVAAQTTVGQPYRVRVSPQGEFLGLVDRDQVAVMFKQAGARKLAGLSDDVASKVEPMVRSMLAVESIERASEGAWPVLAGFWAGRTMKTGERVKIPSAEKARRTSMIGPLFEVTVELADVYRCGAVRCAKLVVTSSATEQARAERLARLRNRVVGTKAADLFEPVSTSMFGRIELHTEIDTLIPLRRTRFEKMVDKLKLTSSGAVLEAVTTTTVARTYLRGSVL